MSNVTFTQEIPLRARLRLTGTPLVGTLLCALLCIVAWTGPARASEPVIEDAPAPVEAPGDPADASPAEQESGALVDPADATGPGLSPFVYGSLGLLATEVVGLTIFIGGSVLFVLTASLAIAGGGVLPILGLVATYTVLLTGLCGFGLGASLGSAGAAAAGAEANQRSGLPYFLGAIPGAAVGVMGGLLAGISFIVIGPVGYLTQGLALFSGSTESLPVELLAGFALQAAAGPIALAGAFGAAWLMGNMFDEAVAEESIDLKANPSVAQGRVRWPLAVGLAPAPARASMRF